jgi:hypothetical protein
LLLHHFFFLSTDIRTVPRTICTLCNDLQWRTQGNSLPLTILSILALTMTNICLLHHCSLFSQEIKLGDNGYRLSGSGSGWTCGWISDWTQEITKNVEKLSQLLFYRCIHFSIVDCLAIVLFNSTIP